MGSLSNTDFERFINDICYEILMYDERFLNDDFEICLLVSRVASAILREYNGFLSPINYFSTDPFNNSVSLFGHRVAFVDADFIPSFDGTDVVVKPVITCKHDGLFPFGVEPGDYVYFGGNLKQVMSVDRIHGNSNIRIADIDVPLDDYYIPDKRRSRDEYIDAVKKIKVRNLEKEAWVETVDTSSINDYLSSLTIT